MIQDNALKIIEGDTMHYHTFLGDVSEILLNN